MSKWMALTAVLLLAACDSRPAADANARAPAAKTDDAAPVADTRDASTGSADSAPGTAATDAQDDPAAVNQVIDDVLGDHTQYETVIRQLQQAVAAKDAATVASLVDYPFTTVRDGAPIRMADADAFVREYDRIVTPEIATAITAQKYSQLMVNYKGVMFGNGQAWVNGICVADACKAFHARVVALQPAP